VEVCPSCGAENREGARFWDAFGAPLADAAPARELRKTVTVFFCDVSGSTPSASGSTPSEIAETKANLVAADRARARLAELA
jgi:class 3 adenylate cyclase